MTSAQPDAIKQSVIAFRSLKIEDRLAALALMYKHIAGQIPVRRELAQPGHLHAAIRRAGDEVQSGAEGQGRGVCGV